MERVQDVPHTEIITMQLQRGDRQNIEPKRRDSDDESLQCRETLNEPHLGPNENRLKTCGCRCRCGLEDHAEDPAQKRRQKRKESKKRQKERQKEAREMALVGLEKIIRDIYGLRVSFKKAQVQIEQCLSIDHNRERLCDFINMVIRDEVEFIRKEIALTIHRYENVSEEQQDEAIKNVFSPILRITYASAQIEKLINVFMAQYSDEEQTPLQKHFGRTTLKFLVKVDLSKSAAFSRICSYIFEAPPEKYPKQRQLVSEMMASFDSLDSPLHATLDYQDSEQDTEDYLDDQDDWEEEESTIQSLKNGLDEEGKKSKNEKNRRKRKQRRRKLKQDIENTFEAIMKRTEQMQVDSEERVDCHVSEQFLVKMRKRKLTYISKSQSAS